MRMNLGMWFYDVENDRSQCFSRVEDVDG
jgi:hypothetical protein